MCMPSLLLQKPSRKSKVKDHITCLKRHLDLWEDGEFTLLIKENEMIQKRFKDRHDPMPDADARITRTIMRLMNTGRTKAAIQLLSRTRTKGIHNLDDEIDGKSVRSILREKHPNAKPVNPDVLLGEPPADTPEGLHLLIFEEISPDDIRQASLHTEGSAGPSGLDAMAWRRLCTSFGESSNGLCAALALFTKRMSTTYIDPLSLSAYAASRLIPPDKCPGVRPIGVGEVCRRIVGKVIMKYAKAEIRRAVGPVQLCGGFESGCEAAFHTMSEIFQDENTEAMLFVDASNAFNQLNQKVTLLNSRSVCPALAPTIINTYRNPSVLYVGGESIISVEGTTQGDPLGLAIYAIGTQPLIQKFKDNAKQVWYADDSSTDANLNSLMEWWSELLRIGPHYGYFPNSFKTKLLVKPEFLSRAEDLFGDTGMHICTYGGKYLGGVIGCKDFLQVFLQSKVEEWKKELETLINIA